MQKIFGIFAFTFFSLYHAPSLAEEPVLKSLTFYPRNVKAGDMVVGIALLQVNDKAHRKVAFRYNECFPSFRGSAQRDERKSSCKVSYLTETLIEIRMKEHISSRYEAGSYSLSSLRLNDKGPSERMDGIAIDRSIDSGFRVFKTRPSSQIAIKQHGYLHIK